MKCQQMLKIALNKMAKKHFRAILYKILDGFELF